MRRPVRSQDTQAAPGTNSGVKRAAIYVLAYNGGEAHSLSPNPREPSLRELVAQRGLRLCNVYMDRAGGTSKRRPGFDALMAAAERGRFQVVVVSSLSEFAQTVRQSVFALDELRALGIDFVSCQEAIDSSAHSGSSLYSIITAMSQLERKHIRQGVVAGLQRARENGTRSGNPVGRPKVVIDRKKVVEMRLQGKSWSEVAKACGAGVTTVRRGYLEEIAMTSSDGG